MAGEKLLVLQTNGRKKQGPLLTSLSGGTNEDFDIASPSTQVSPVTVFTTISKIDVWVNGQMQREGASFDFQRDATLNKINFTYSVPASAWVRVRLF